MRRSLNIQIAVGAVVGILLGIGLGHLHLPAVLTSPALTILTILGKIFIGLLKILVAPLILTSIAVGIAHLRDTPQLKTIWQPTLAYFCLTPLIAVITGLTAANIFKPGAGLDTGLFSKTTPQTMVLTPSEFGSKILDSLFVNPITALAQSNVLAIILFAVLLGCALAILGTRAAIVTKGLEELYEVIMTLVSWVMRLAPFGIAGLLAELVAHQDLSLFGVAKDYMILVVGVTLFHGIVTLPTLLWITTKVTPWQFFTAMREALLTAFATSSSNATLPINLRCTIENLKVDKKIAGFVLPLGATVNMDGTALYEAMAALFVANLCHIELNLMQQAVVAVTAMLASIGAPGIPSAGMVTMAMVLQSVGLPLEALGLLLPLDRPLDTIRTVVNVEGDSIGARIVQKFSAVS